MFRLGKKQRLTVSKETRQGFYLKEPETMVNGESPSPTQNKKPRYDNKFIKKGYNHRREDEIKEILLPTKLAPEGLCTGDIIEVFIYRDSEDRLIATTLEPALTLGETAVLDVKEVGAVGAFLDWGLEKDLLLPFHEQLYKVKKGDKVLTALYIDKSSRLCATMNVYEYLRTDSTYKKDDSVTGTVYGVIPKFGVYVAVDNRYSAMIPAREIRQELKLGEVVTARVTKVHSDGKIDLSLQKKAFLQIDEDSEKIYEKLVNAGGFLPFHDKSEPNDIKDEFNMSKNSFKRAIGHLNKEGKIAITAEGIYTKSRE